MVVVLPLFFAAESSLFNMPSVSLNRNQAVRVPAARFKQRSAAQLAGQPALQLALQLVVQLVVQLILHADRWPTGSAERRRSCEDP